MTNIYAVTRNLSLTYLVLLIIGFGILFSDRGPGSVFGGAALLTFSSFFGLVFSALGLLLQKMLWKQTQKFPLSMVLHGTVLAASLGTLVWMILFWVAP